MLVPRDFLRRSACLIGLGAILALAAAPPCAPAAADDAAPTVLFQDSFADLSHWNAPPQWRVENGSLVVNGGGIHISKEGREWKNYALDFDVTIRQKMAQWVLRAADERNCLFIQLTANDCPYSPNTLRCHSWRNGNLDKIEEDPALMTIEAGKSYHIRCEVIGNTVHTFIDGKLRSQWPFAHCETGGIGFRNAGEESAEYRNLRVTRCESFTPNPAQQRKAPVARVRTDPFLKPPFRAEWIWGDGEELDRVFRFPVQLSADPLDARLWITADNAFRLFVNGKLVGKGDDWQSPKILDLKPYLRRGKNVLAVAAHNDGPGAAGILAEGNILLPDGKNVPLVSNSAWRTAVNPAQGWQQPGYAEQGWSPALSLGRHPQGPWAGQVDWQLPYLRPQVLATVESCKLPGMLQRGRPAPVSLRLRLAQPLKSVHPVRLWLTLPNGQSLVAASAYPAGKPLAAGEQRLQFTLPLSEELYLPAGRYTARVELVGVYPRQGAERLRLPVSWTSQSSARLKPLPLSKRPMGPGLFTDQFGKAHHYRLDGSWLVYDGARLCPLALGGGAYWCLDDPARRATIESLRDEATLARVRREGLTEEPVRVRLLDEVVSADPKSEAAHQFSEDDGYGGQSRLMRIGDRTYRVTASGKRLSYFAYTLNCRKPGQPHLILFETPNDRERYTMVRIQPPWRNVGCGPFTGRDLPLDGKAYQAGFVFYPEEQAVRLTVSRLPCELEITPESGGAVSRLCLFEFADDLAARRAEMAPTPGPQRRIGLSLTHPAYLYDLYGQRYGDLTQRLASLNAFANYADFVGMNYLEFNAVNGADTSETAYYPSQIWPQYRGDANLFRELVPIAEQRGFGLVPCLTSLAFDIPRFTDAPWISPLTFQIDKDGWGQRDFFRGRGNDNTLPDPLRPETQKVFLQTLREFGENCRKSPAVLGLAFRLNGKIGTCYVGYNETETAETAGYSPWNLAEFQKECGVRIPGWDEGLTERWVAAKKAGRREDPAVRFIPQAYEWIRANCWQQWLDWRCHRLNSLFLQARDLTRSFRKDWNLVVKCDMPSETPERNILWPSGVSALDLFRGHGFDPRPLEKEPGILLQQGYFLGGGEYFTCNFGSPYAKNPAAWTAFDRQPGLAELFRTPAGTSAEFYNNYWEENGASRMGEFATTFWGAGMMYPRGRYFFQPLLHAIRVNNVQAMALFSWERGSEGHEGELRRFCRAYRALPAVTGKAFAGKVEVTDGPAADETLWARRFGSRIALINESAQPRTVRVTLPAVPAGQGVYEYASQRRLARAAKTGAVTVSVTLDAFDLRVLGAE